MPDLLSVIILRNNNYAMYAAVYARDVFSALWKWQHYLLTTNLILCSVEFSVVTDEEAKVNQMNISAD